MYPINGVIRQKRKEKKKRYFEKRGTCGGRRITTQKLFSSCAKVVTGTRYSSKTLCNEEPWTLKLKKQRKLKLSIKTNISFMMESVVR